MKGRPIKPDEVVEMKGKNIPPEVYDAFNELIVTNFAHGEANVLQSQVVNRIASKLQVGRQLIYDNHWLDVEDVYRAEGWTVVYDKPAYNETYPARFTFKNAPSNTQIV